MAGPTNQSAELRALLSAASGFGACVCNFLLFVSWSPKLGGGFVPYRGWLIAGSIIFVTASVMLGIAGFKRRRQWTFDFVLATLLAGVLALMNGVALVDYFSRHRS